MNKTIRRKMVWIGSSIILVMVIVGVSLFLIPERNMYTGEFFSFKLPDGWIVENEQIFSKIYDGAENEVARFYYCQHFAYGDSTDRIVANMLGASADIVSEYSVETGDPDVAFQRVEVSFMPSAAMAEKGEKTPNELHYFAVVGKMNDLYMDIQLKDETKQEEIEGLIKTMRFEKSEE